jgi:hypothetical protein
MITVTTVAQSQPDLPFCGLRAKSKKFIEMLFGDTYRFFRVVDNDTIVDIGASSGAQAGALSAILDIRHVTFVLVDIDTGCLNLQRVQHMKAFYERLKGSSIENQFRVVNNTPDSLWLPPSTYKKVWLINTLHEIPNKLAMVKAIAGILRSRGEVIVLERIAISPGQKHGGCHLPLLNEDELVGMFQTSGFTIIDRLDRKVNKQHVVTAFRFQYN